MRACDGGPKPRCGVARAAIRGEARGGRGRPQLLPVPPLQVAELDPPGFLLTMLQATDPDGDALFYDILGNACFYLILQKRTKLSKIRKEFLI